jgi:cytoskeletal protein CcmA (bactofilin family)
MSDVTVIGNSIFISGNIEGKEDLSVRGRIEGNITLSNTLFLEDSGIIKADVTVKNAVISGVLVGNIEAEEGVEITEIGQMVGDIVAPRVIIRDGAKFRGNIDMTSYESSQDSVKKIESSTFKRPALKTTKTVVPPRRTFTPTTSKNTTSTNTTTSNNNSEIKTPAVNDKLSSKESEKINNAIKETVNEKDIEKKKELTEKK